MAQYNISVSGNQLVVELIVTGGDFSPNVRTFKSPSIKLTPETIKFNESGIYKMSLNFNEINEIGGIVPTDLEDAANLVTDLIANFNGGGASPDLTGYATETWVDDNYSKYLLRVVTPTANVTGTTAETVLYTWFVPANTFLSTDRISIDDFTCACNGTLINSNTARIRFNTENTLPPLLTENIFATILLTPGSVDRYFRASRIVDFNEGKIRGHYNISNLYSDIASNTYTSNDFDTTVDNWFFFTIQPADISNSIYMKNLIIKR